MVEHAIGNGEVGSSILLNSTILIQLYLILYIRLVMTTPHLDIESYIESIRRFNRGYAQKIGIFAEKVFDSKMSITELRVLHEINIQKQTTATHLCKVLGLDGGYLSRILNKFEKAGYIAKQKSLKDARQRRISLTATGKKEWSIYSQKANQNIVDMILPLNVQQQKDLIAAMTTIAVLLGIE